MGTCLLYKISFKFRLLFLSFRLLQGSTEDGEDSKDPGDKAGKIEFSQVFGLLAFGAVSVALNSKLLGGSL